MFVCYLYFYFRMSAVVFIQLTYVNVFLKCTYLMDYPDISIGTESIYVEYRRLKSRHRTIT